MILCDIGNTFLHFYYRGRIWKEEKHKLTPKDSKELIMYISVNEDSTNALLYAHPRCFDLTPYINIDTNYKGLGVDRIAACKAINDGVIVDAGSALTIDVMHQGIHLGGFIMPGIAQYRKMFGSISVLAQSAVYATEVSPQEYLAYTTEETEKIEVLRLADTLGGDIETAIKRLAEERNNKQ